MSRLAPLEHTHLALPLTHLSHFDTSILWYAVAVTIADDESLSRATQAARNSGIGREPLYEVCLQSYLFLGFPRMLNAAEHLHDHWPADREMLDSINAKDCRDWYDRGEVTCRQVYGDHFDRLKSYLTSVAPEIFQWMLLVGYGKVLSRPGLPLSSRELAIVAMLTVDDRPRQLYAHLRGALNVGVPIDQLRETLDLVASYDGETANRAQTMLEHVLAHR